MFSTHCNSFNVDATWKRKSSLMNGGLVFTALSLPRWSGGACLLAAYKLRQIDRLLNSLKAQPKHV